MARHETDREDLMREATALRQRAEFRVPGFQETVIVGYRRDGSLSIYFGPDPCYHFDPQLRLRRAFIDSHLYRTQGESLARLTRVRDESSVELRRHDLTPDELGDVVRDIAERLSQLRDGLAQEAECIESVPPDANLPTRLLASLTSLTTNPLQLAPAIRGKR